MIVFVLRVIFLIFFVFIGLSVLYLFISSFWGRFFFRKKFTLPAVVEPVKKIAILVPAYKEDGIILSTAEGLLTLDYPRELYDIYIIADSFQPETIQQLRQLPIEVVEVSFVKSTKAKSLNETFSRITRSYDIALICDADNIFSRDFLKWLDYAFQQGARAVQGRRIAKNLDSPFAILDACSEAINNHLFRKGSNALGLSSAVIGSGMAFEYDAIKEVLLQVDSVVEDKELALGIAEKGLFIHYLEDAVIYDEKVGSAKAFGNQRKRWVSGQHAFLQKFFLPSFRQLARGNVSYFNLGFFQGAIMPRSFLFVFCPLLVVAGFLMGTIWGIFSGIIFILFILSLTMGVPRSLVNKDLLHAILKLPKAIWIMFGTLLHLNKAHKTFIHTVHTKTEVSNSLFNDNGK